MKPSIYLTTSIPYVNAAPHLGFAQEAVIADTLARYHRMRGRELRFLSGTDENGLKNALAAEQQGMPVEALVADNAQRFQALGDVLNLSYDDFIRTSTDPRHAPAVAALWQACERSGDIYRRDYEGLYCTGCEQFYRNVELDQGRCPEHGTAPERVAEENYFFRLTRYAGALHDLIRRDVLRIMPAHRRNEILRLLEGGVEDISISRSAARAHGWGIAVPGDAEQIVYVWFDALTNYISALGYGSDDGALLERFWHGNARRLHVIGKGVTRFHAVYWPAILLSAGLALPDEILVHGYVTLNGGKLSKSRGATVDPVTVIERFPVDALRYYLLRHIGTYHDGDFSWGKLTAVYNRDLAGGLGNLASRTFALVRRCLQADRIAKAWQPDAGLLDLGCLPETVAGHVDHFALHGALAEIWQAIDRCNAFINAEAPWQRQRDGEREQLARVLATLNAALETIAGTLAPFLPETAARILDQCGRISAAVECGTAPPAFAPLFPRRSA